jgi:hypothetical protein
MPITPFHFGPGYLVKSACRKRFSFFVFVLSQIIIDLEPLYNMITDKHPVHGRLHTFLGSLIVVGITVLLAKPLAKGISKFLKFFPTFRKNIDGIQDYHFRVIWISAFVGGWSHVFLDSIMHLDMRPFWPFSNANPLLEIVSLLTLHIICIAMGMIGLGYSWTYTHFPKRSGQPPSM